MKAETATVADPPTYSLALEEARRAFDRQVDQVAVVRTRAIQLLGWAATAVSVFGGFALHQGQLLQLVLGGLAAAAFVVVVVLCLLVMRGRDLTLAVDPVVLAGWVEVPGVTQSWMEGQLAVALGRTYDANLKEVNAMYRDFRRALGALFVELILLAIAFTGGLF
jgi:hypothetical protein